MINVKWNKNRKEIREKQQADINSDEMYTN